MVCVCLRFCKCWMPSWAAILTLSTVGSFFMFIIAAFAAADFMASTIAVAVAVNAVVITAAMDTIAAVVAVVVVFVSIGPQTLSELSDIWRLSFLLSRTSVPCKLIDNPRSLSKHVLHTCQCAY